MQPSAEGSKEASSHGMQADVQHAKDGTFLQKYAAWLVARCLTHLYSTVGSGAAAVQLLLQIDGFIAGVTTRSL